MAEVGIIETDVPIPPKRGGSAHPIAELKVGQSRLIKGVPHNQVSAKAGDIARVMGRRFTTRAMDGGIRVWRTA